jgi:hypothetical protein
VRKVKSGRKVACELEAPSGRQIRIVVLSDADSLALWKVRFAGHESVVLSPAGIIPDGDALRIFSETPRDLRAQMFSAQAVASGRKDGIFRRLELPEPKAAPMRVSLEPIRPAGPPREIPLSTGKSHIALAPTEADFTNAAVWQVRLPANLDLSLDPILRVRYAGDVARFTLNGELIDDNFYSGRLFDLGLKRFAPEILNGDLRLEILPLRKDAPIYLAGAARADFGKSDVVAIINQIEIVNRYHAAVPAAAGRQSRD